MILTLLGCAQDKKEREQVNSAKIEVEFYFGTYSGVYTGTLYGDVPVSEGKFVVMNDNNGQWTYEGEWQYGHMSGNGALRWTDGKTLEGKFDKDYLVDGKHLQDGILVYEGKFSENLYHGYGSLYYDGNIERSLRLIPILGTGGR